jgi:PAS domain S-box-containing protein
MLGRTRDEVLGKSVFDFYPVEEASRLMAADRATLEAENGQLTFEESLTTPAHGTRWLKTTKVAVRDKDGEPRYLLGFSQDITEQKGVEQQLRQAIKMDAVGQLTGGIAHDFNNLLGVVIGNLDFVIEAEEVKTDSVTALKEALEAAMRGSELTRRLLVFSRNQPRNSAVVDVNRGLMQNANMIRRLLGGLIVVDVRQAPDLWFTRADAAQLDEAILNMAINARDAMPKGGAIVIETQNVHVDRTFAARNAGLKPGDYVLLTISDTGEGMSAETVERCFEPFFTTKASGKGTGLGLSMVYGFVKQSGGYIKIESKLGVGTTIGVYLPRADADAPTEVAAAGAPKIPDAENELILVVEDEPDLRKTTLRALSELGYRTLEAENVASAIRVLAQNPEVDLLFTDVMMPGGKSGLDLARHARQIYPDLKILLTSGFMGQLADEVEELPEILSKPFRKKELAERVRMVLGSE